jgi:preprotein translocase subunit YajC
MKVYGKKPNTDNVLSMLTPRIAERKSFKPQISALQKGAVVQPLGGFIGNVRTFHHGRATAA